MNTWPSVLALCVLSASTSVAGAQAPPPVQPPGPRVTASFDCTQARTPSEILICSDRYLSRMDRYLGRVYSDAHNALRGRPRKALYREQLNWIRRRSRECRVLADFSSNEFRALERRGCLYRWTLARVMVLQGRYRASTGKDHPLVGVLAQDLADGPLSRRR